MNTHNHHHETINNLRSTTQILNQSASTFSTHFLTFIFLSFVLLTFRSNLETGTHFLTHFIDHNPVLRNAVVSNPNPSTLSPQSTAAPADFPKRRRRGPFLQLTRVGTLNDDFFSNDENDEIEQRPTSIRNASYMFLYPRLGFYEFGGDVSNGIGGVSGVDGGGGDVSEVDNGIRVSEVVRNGVNFKAVEKKEENVSDESESKNVFDVKFVFRGLDVGRKNVTELLFLVGFISVSYGYVILGFVVVYGWILGIVFVVVVNDLLGRYKSFFRAVWDGSQLGAKRLSGFILMRWAVRDALTQILGIWFFGEVEDQYSLFKLFVRLKLMPFSVSTSWVKGFERESYWFLICWFLMDTLVAFIFAVDAWVVMVDTRKSGREVVKEGCRLLSLMLNPAINIKCIEGIVCGSLARWLLSRFCGKLFALAFQSVTEVYFMVVWLMYFFSAKSRDASSRAVPFGQRELEGFLDGVR